METPARLRESNDTWGPRNPRNAKMKYSASKLPRIVSLFEFNLVEPVAVQALTRKLEQSLKQIEQEVELLAGQVEQQDEAIQTTVKKVAKEYMVQRIHELQMEIAGDGTLNQRAGDLGDEYMVEDSEIGLY